MFSTWRSLEQNFELLKPRLDSKNTVFQDDSMHAKYFMNDSKAT